MPEIIIAAIANLLTRFLPFIFLKKYYKDFLYLKNEFPTVMLTILTLYMIYSKDISILNFSYKLFGVFITIIIHLLFRRFLLSVFIGSLTYIILINSKNIFNL